MNEEEIKKMNTEVEHKNEEATNEDDELAEILKEIEQKAEGGEEQVHVENEQQNATNDVALSPAVNTHNTISSSYDEYRYVCPYCGKKFKTQHALGGHMRACPLKPKVEDSVEDGGEGEDEDVLITSPKEELEQWFIKELERRLPKKVVSEDRAKIVIETIKENPDIIWNPYLLRNHIVQVCAGAKINQYLLDLTLNNLYKKLEQKTRELEMTYGMPLFGIGPIAPPGQSMMPFNPMYQNPYARPPSPYANMPQQNPFMPMNNMNNPFMQNQNMPPFGMQNPMMQTPFGQQQNQNTNHPQPPVIIKKEPERKKEDDFKDKLLMILMDKLISKLDEKDKKDEEKKEEPTVPVKIGEATIPVPVSQYAQFMLMKQMIEQSQKSTAELAETITAMLGALMTQNQPKEKDDEQKEPLVPVIIDGQVKKLPASEAVQLMLYEQQKKEKEMLEQEVRMMREQMQKMYEVLSPENLTKVIEQMGYTKSGSPTLELIHATRKDLSAGIDRLITLIEKNIEMQRLQMGIPPGGGFGGAKYSPQERKQKLNKLKKAINNAQEVAKLEEELQKNIKNE